MVTDPAETGEGKEREDRNADVLRAQVLRNRMCADPHRPTYHFTYPGGGYDCPGDPNGAIFWNGRYHLFYLIQNEEGCCWGHRSSVDLLHWREHPLALTPTEGKDHTEFSGGIFVDKQGVPTISYWGVGQGICLARSTDPDLDVWEKLAANPVITADFDAYKEHGIKVLDDGRVVGAADPSAIWVKDDRYYMATGNLLVLNKLWRNAEPDKKDPRYKGDWLDLFVSDDLETWEYMHRFYEYDERWGVHDDEDNMCPDFFPIGDKHMILCISHNHGCRYYLGDYRDDRLHPEQHGRMSWNDNGLFAPESLLDDKGRRIMWAWIFDGRPDEEKRESGWSGSYCLPRVLSLGEDGTLRMCVIEELARLRHGHREYRDLTVQEGADQTLDAFTGNTIELSVEIDPGDAAQVGVKVCVSPDGQEETLIYYDAAAKKLVVDPSRASRRTDLKPWATNPEEGPFDLKDGETLKLRVFVDKSIVEVFANDRQAVMRRIYPALAGSRAVRLFSTGGAMQVRRVEAWQVWPSNPY